MTLTTLRDRPILFSGPMVRGLIREVEKPGTGKTQARRIIKPPAPYASGDDIEAALLAGNIPLRFAKGDRLWVRETWAPLDRLAHNDPGTTALIERGFYKADNSTVEGSISRWTPAIHMPRRYSRLTLTVSDVRVQRLREINHADAKAEGVTPFAPHRAPPGGCHDDGGDSSGFDDCARCAFKMLWAQINGIQSWDANPWVVALTFSVELRNIDHLSREKESGRASPHQTPPLTDN